MLYICYSKKYDRFSFLHLTCTYTNADCGIIKILIYVQLKLYITESIGLTEPTPDITDTNTNTNTKSKLGIGLGSYQKPVPTTEPENSI